MSQNNAVATSSIKHQYPEEGHHVMETIYRIQQEEFDRLAIILDQYLVDHPQWSEKSSDRKQYTYA